jgi:VWFA-related protein
VRQLFAPSSRARSFRFALRLLLSSLLCLSFFLNPAAAQDVPAIPSTVASKPEIDQDSVELASHDEPTKFQVNVKLVIVRVVARDSQGHAIGNLRKEDFQIFDKGKLQTITQFEVEQAGSRVAKTSAGGGANAGATSADTSATGAVAPVTLQHFVAYLFDDVHLEFPDLARVQEAAEHHLGTLHSTDRAAIFTTSGLTTLDFTDDKNKLRETLIRLHPHPISSYTTKNTCPEISYYQADLIINKHDPDALQVAVTEAIECGPQGSTTHGSIPLGNPALVAAKPGRRRAQCGEARKSRFSGFAQRSGAPGFQNARAANRSARFSWFSHSRHGVRIQRHHRSRGRLASRH